MRLGDWGRTIGTLQYLFACFYERLQFELQITVIVFWIQHSLLRFKRYKNG